MRHNKLLAGISVGSGVGSPAIVYTAPSGTAIGAIRGARLLYVHFQDHSGSGSVAQILVNGAPFIKCTVPANGKQAFNVNLPLEPGHQLSVDCGTAVYYYFSGEELTIG